MILLNENIVQFVYTSSDECVSVMSIGFLVTHTAQKC